MAKACFLVALLALAGCAAPTNYVAQPDPCSAGEATMDCQAYRYRNMP